ncbi:hypothetical protein BCR22_11920 [Enterococcus plantarum]|uniref:hypothetical protein n=1 Tax=Enterococcus plantarum TaxID=1077675 RepID=UPI00084DEBC2|nr:hypothetical protein [Enterococcus plantarum]OEG18072.1 hypothetical protein BCR22_11920 [Enterococcus plantarum]
MKKLVLSSALLAIIGVGTIGTSVFADEVQGNSKESKVNVTIEDEDSGTDPLDPTDPDQKLLNLISVPEKYDFTSSLTNGTYSLTTTLSDQDIEVFNSRSTREWSVKASVAENKLTSDSTNFDVTSFKINNNELVGAGATPIVAKNGELTAEANTGTLSTPVTTASISFSDPSGKLKVGSQLTGTINYQLYNTANAN